MIRREQHWHDRVLRLELLDERLLLSAHSFATATEIAVDTVVAGSIATVDTQDFYSVTLTDSGQFAANISSPGPGRLDAVLSLFSADEQLLISSAAGSNSLDSPALIAQHLPSGAYFLVVSGVSGAGDYELSSTVTIATPPFAEIPVGIYPAALVAGDFNGDTIVDLATSDRFGNSVSVLLGLGDGTYRPAVSYAVGEQPLALVAADFNHDSHLDLAVANSGAGGVSLLLGNGDAEGTFAAAVTLLEGTSPSALTGGNFTADQEVDLAVVDGAAGQVTILGGDGQGGFVAAEPLAVGANPQSIVAGDFDGNGRTDLAIANRDSSDVSLLLQSAGGVLAALEPIAVGSQPTSIAAGDFNGDARLDLAVANANDDTVTLLLRASGGGVLFDARTIDIRQAPPISASGDFKSFVLAADFNGDGVFDLAVANSVDASATVALGDGSGQFGRRTQIPLADYSQPQALVAGDFNGDSRPDLAASGALTDQVSIRLSVGDGDFQTRSRLAVGSEAYGVIVGDFNHDGQGDIATANQGPDTVSILLGLGGGRYQPAVSYPVAEPVADPLTDSGPNPTAITQADFNGDGRVDLATANFIANTVSLLLGLGDGTFGLPATFAVGEAPFAIASGDFNDDGNIDVATANITGGNTTVLLSDGHGDFGPPITLESGASTLAVVAGTFDDDALGDVATIGFDAGNPDDPSDDHFIATVFLGQADGSLSAQPPLAIENDPRGLVVGDFNDDGRYDVAVISPDASGLFVASLYLQEPAGGFAAGAQFAVGDDPHAIVAGDFNSDGRLDVATLNLNSSDVSVLLAQADGSLASEQRFPVGAFPFALATRDVNGDGRLDLVSSNLGTSDVSVLFGLGDGAFVSPDRFASGVAGATPLLSDFDGDGANDSIVVNQAGNILLRLGRTDAAGTFAAPRVINPGRPARAIAILQVGGQPRIAAADLLFGNVAIYSRSENGQVVLAADLVSPGAQPVRIVSGDLDGDGRDDLAVADAASQSVGIYLTAADGSLSLSQELPAATDPADLALVDLNDDGRDDLLVVDQISSAVSILINHGDAGFAAADRFRAAAGQAGFAAAADAVPTLLSRDSSAAVAWGDFDEDGQIDLIVADRGANELALLAGLGNGRVGNSRRILAGSQPTAVRSADLNGDGHLDLAVLNAGGRDISLFFGDGHGALHESNRMDAGNEPTGLNIDDVDDDGLLDLVIGNRFGDVMTLRGLGSGQFQPFTRAGRNVAIAVGDIDGDGHDDWAVTNQTQDRVAVKLSGEPSSFQQRRDDGVQAPGAVKTGDLNGDDILDMIVANSGANNVLVYLGSGGGQFAAARTFFAGTNPVGVDIADVNADSLPDLIVTNEGSNDVSILLGDNDLLLRPGPRLDVGRGPTESQVGDFNDDGMPDLLVTSTGSNQVFMLPGVGGGFFNDSNPTVFATGDSPRHALVGQFDGVGGLDLITTNYGSNSVSLYSSMNVGARIDFGSGGSGPIAAVAVDLNLDGMLDLVIGNNGDGALSIFLGSQDGLVLTGSLFEANAQHPTALALAETGELNQLSLLMADEGDELVSVFTRETVVASSTNATPLAFAIATAGLRSLASSLSISGVSLATLSSIAQNLTAILSSMSGGGASDLSGDGKVGGAQNAIDPALIMKKLNSALQSGRQWLKSMLGELSDEQLGKATATVVDAIEEVLGLALPGVPWQVLVKPMESIFGGAAPHSLPPAAVDQSLRSEHFEEWIEQLDGRELPTDRPDVDSQSVDFRSVDQTSVDRSTATADEHHVALLAASVLLGLWIDAGPKSRSYEKTLTTEAIMTDLAKAHASDKWWGIADCVDQFQSVAATVDADLAELASKVEPAQRSVALVELVKLDLEKRWRQGDRRRIEQYLKEFPELSTSEQLEELAHQECRVRTSHGDTPTIEELRSRFPSLDEMRVLEGPQGHVGTVQLGAQQLETRRFDSSSGVSAPSTDSHVGTDSEDIAASDHGPSGTIVHDSRTSASGSKPAVAKPGDSTLPASGTAGIKHGSIAQSLADPDPANIGRYTIVKRLGSGSFGLVYQCFDVDLKRDVAIKVPHRRSASRDRVKEFLHEARSAARLRHPNIVNVLDTSQTEDGRVYIVYEFIKGSTLENVLEKGGYSFADVARWVADSADALHHAHKNGIVHRDIKPANILIDEQSRPHVADFGLARMDDQYFKNDAGMVLGTVAYMSPEQASGSSHWATAQTDIYSLGVVLYQMLCHKLPFTSGSIREILEQVKERPVAPPRTIDDTIPKSLESICLKAMAKLPSERYNTAADMAVELRSAQATAAPPMKTTGYWIGSGAAAAAIAGLFLWAPWRHDENSRNPNPAAGGQGALASSSTGRDTAEAPPMQLSAGTPQMSIHFQGATQQGVWQPLRGKGFAIHEGDKVQLHVKIAGEVPKYVYFYWYDAQGKPLRLWPIDAGHQQKVAKVQAPATGDENDWLLMDAERGAEMAIVAVRDEPLDEAELLEFEAEPPYAKNVVRLSEVYQVASGELQRGVAGLVKSRKNPLDTSFEKSLADRFGAYHGMVIPHQ